MAVGFKLEVEDYCSYCGDFEPSVEKTEIARFGEKAKSYITAIKCDNAYKCARIRENLKVGLEHGKRE